MLLLLFFNPRIVDTYDVTDISPNLVNQSSTKETKALMHFLKTSYGNYIISGQQDLSDADYLYDLTGKKPAILGLDFYDYTTASKVGRGSISYQVEQAIEWAKQGGIVTFTWHWVAPTNMYTQPIKDWETGFYVRSTNFDISYALNNKNSREYKLLVTDIDKVADQIKRLKDNNIPILFRPLHEAEGGWFWWGSKGPEPAKELYKLIYDRLTNIHKLNNIIWIWNSSQENWYPGNEYVDIVSYDSYPKQVTHKSMIDEYRKLLSLTKSEKLIAMSENGPIPNPENLQKDQAYWSWFMTWRQEFITNGIYNNPDFLKKVYNSPYVITLDEVPNIYK